MGKRSRVREGEASRESLRKTLLAVSKLRQQKENKTGDNRGKLCTEQTVLHTKAY